MSSHQILLVEDHEPTRTFLADQLTADGYEILLAHNRRHALHLLAGRHPQLVLADINGETLGLLDAVRGGEGLAGEIDPNTPMIVLSARADELDRVRVFDRGGDDVVAKPFSYPELRGRIRALLRRAYEPHSAPVTRIGALTIDHRGREAAVAGRPIKLAAKEFELLRCLAVEPTRVFTKVNFDHASPREQGCEGLGAGLAILFPGEVWLLVCRALRGLGSFRRATGRICRQCARAHSRGRISAASAATASRPTRGRRPSPR